MQYLREEHRYLLLFLLFLLSFTVHMLGLNLIGRTWDEQFKVDMGYIAYDRLGAGDLSVPSWNFGIEHPMVAKYIYGFFLGSHLIRLDNGAGGYAVLSPWDQLTLQDGNFLITQLYDKLFAVMYDLTFPRVISALFNSLAVVLTALIGIRFLGYRWGWLPAIFLLFIPRFVVMGQLITFETLSVLLFCISIAFGDQYLKNPTRLRYVVGLGIITGLLFWTRYNNVFVFLFLAGWLLLNYGYYHKKNIFSLKLLLIPVIAFFVGFSIWPLLWQEFPKYLIETFRQHESRGIRPSFYFAEYLLITTPVPILFGLVVGVYAAIKERSYWQSFLLWWFFATLVFFSLLSVHGGGTRYIFVLYPALGILAGYGYSVILKKKFVYALIPIFLILLFEMSAVFPYYLDYYNQFVGGPGGAARRGYDFSWWGEGQREVGIWMDQNLPSEATVGLIVTPKYVFPRIRTDLKNQGYVNANTDADYVVVSRWDHKSLPQKFLSTHSIVYSSRVDNEPLVYVFKRK